MSLKTILVALRELAVINPDQISDESKSLAEKRRLDAQKREISKKKRIEESCLLLQCRAQWVARSTSVNEWFAVIELGDYITEVSLDEAKKCKELDPIFVMIYETEGLTPFVGYSKEKDANDQLEKIPVLFACWADEIPPNAPGLR